MIKNAGYQQKNIVHLANGVKNIDDSNKKVIVVN